MMKREIFITGVRARAYLQMTSKYHLYTCSTQNARLFMALILFLYITHLIHVLFTMYAFK